MSLRRACALLDVARSGATYASKREAVDAPVIARMRELAKQYPHYGYRMIQLLLAKQRLEMSVDRTPLARAALAGGAGAAEASGAIPDRRRRHGGAGAP